MHGLVLNLHMWCIYVSGLYQNDIMLSLCVVFVFKSTYIQNGHVFPVSLSTMLS